MSETIYTIKDTGLIVLALRIADRRSQLGLRRI